MNDECGMMNEKRPVPFHSSFITPHSSFLFARSHGDEDRALAGARDEQEQGAFARVLNRRAQVFDRLQGLPVRLLDEVALLQTSVRARPRRVNVRDDEALLVFRQAEALRQLRRERREREAELAALALSLAASAARLPARAVAVFCQLTERDFPL